MERRTTRLGSNKSAFRTLHRGDFFVPGTELPAQARVRKLAIQAGFRPPFACTPQPFKAEPRSGLGRLPKAPRVHACEAWPRAPHPTGLGYPAPIKLSLCPTSVTPLEAPLIGQDTASISARGRAGIGIHSQVRERRFADFFVARMPPMTRALERCYDSPAFRKRLGTVCNDFLPREFLSAQSCRRSCLVRCRRRLNRLLLPSGQRSRGRR
jgi:hypothetical protein